VPNSLLAEQDLEGEEKSEGECSECSAEGFVGYCGTCGKYKTKKGQIEKSEGEDDDIKNPEQAWTSLKRMRKDLEGMISGLTSKMTKADEERGGISGKIKEAKKKLNEVNGKINKVLEYMKVNG
jgi:peptidoglycan hydrolase CwlO-like protein